MRARDSSLTAEEALRVTLDVAPSVETLAQRLDELSDYNVRQAKDRAEAIELNRYHHTVAVAALDGIAAVGALAAFWVAYRSMRRYEAELRRRARELDSFAGRVAHDLVSPLSAAKFSFGMLRCLPALLRRAGGS